MNSNQKDSIKLNNCQIMPTIGLGTYKTKDQESLTQLLRKALELGYRHIDTAKLYENEEQIGHALQEIYKEGVYRREDIFLVTKVLPYKDQDTLQVVKQSLKNLQTDYVDILYLHWSACPPIEGDKINHKPVFQMWGELEKCVELGYAKSLGISNFNVQSMLDLFSYCKVFPVCNQVEVNVYFQQPRLLEFCQRFKITVVAYTPLARCKQEDVIIKELAEKYKKSDAQIMLNFLINLNISIIPKTSNMERLKENYESLLFQMSEEDHQKIKNLNKNQRTIDPYAGEFWKKIPCFE